MMVHIAVGVLLIAFAAGIHTMCKGKCGDGECEPKCRKVKTVLGGLIVLLSFLMIVCSIYKGVTKQCQYSKKGSCAKCHSAEKVAAQPEALPEATQ
jgi:TM2 domain-containing membrane protein YozV